MGDVSAVVDCAKVLREMCPFSTLNSSYMVSALRLLFSEGSFRFWNEETQKPRSDHTRLRGVLPKELVAMNWHTVTVTNYVGSSIKMMGRDERHVEYENR